MFKFSGYFRNVLLYRKAFYLKFFTLFEFGRKQSAINSNCCNPQATLVRPLGGPMLPTTLSIPKYFLNREKTQCVYPLSFVGFLAVEKMLSH